MQHLLNKIHHADCLEFMKGLPDKCIDLVLTDPPYGIGYDKSIANKGGEQYGNAAAAKKHYHTSDWDNSIPDKEVFEQMQRISKNQIIFGGNYFAHILPASRGWLCWDKMTGENNFSDCELAWTSLDMPLRKIEFMWNGMLQGDMKNKEERIHPTQKPRQLFMMILEKYAKQGQTILDCFSGSGTTALACHDLGLDFICVEKDADYHAASVKRLEQHQRQLKLI